MGWGRKPPQVAALNWRNRRREVERENTPECRAFQVDVRRCHVEAARPKLIWEVFPGKGEAAGRTIWTEMCGDGFHLSREKKKGSSCQRPPPSLPSKK